MFSVKFLKIYFQQIQNKVIWKLLCAFYVNSAWNRSKDKVRPNVTGYNDLDFSSNALCILLKHQIWDKTILSIVML